MPWTREGARKGGRKGNPARLERMKKFGLRKWTQRMCHFRWHERRGVVSQNCEWCLKEAE
jgi:hypothetical protein